MTDDASVVTHLVISYGDYQSSESLAAVLNHVARYADSADAIQFAHDGVFDATERAIDALSQIRDSAKHVRGARHW